MNKFAIAFCGLLFLFCSLHGKAQSTTELSSAVVKQPDSIRQIALQLSQQSENRDSALHYSYVATKALLYQGQLKETIGASDSLLALKPDPQLEVMLINLKASCHFYLSDLEAASQGFRLVLQQSRVLKDTNNYTKAIANLSAVFQQLSVADSVIKYVELTMELDRAKGNTDGIASNYNILGATYLNLKLYLKGAELLKQGLTYESRPITRANLHLNLASAYHALKAPEPLLPHLEKAKELFYALNNPRGVMQVTSLYAGYYEYSAQYDKVMENTLKAIELARALNAYPTLAGQLNRLGINYFRKGQAQKALEAAREAHALNHALGRKDFAATSASYLALYFSQLQRPDSAIFYLSEMDTLQNFLLETEYVSKLSEAEGRLKVAEQKALTAEQALALKAQELTIAEYQVRQLALGAAIGLVLLLGLLGFVQFRNRQRQRFQHQLLAEKQRSITNEIQAAEKERGRISRELHDGIGQELSALKLNLSHLMRKEDTDNWKEELRDIGEQLASSATEVRHLSHQMMPRALSEQGIVPALEQLLSTSFRSGAVNYAFEHSQLEVELPKELEVILYRIAQELLNNVVKHSRANHVEVQLYQTQKQLVLHVEDNGIGFDEQTGSGHGMNNIRNRVAMFDGRLNIHSGEKEGTSITASFPKQLLEKHLAA